eukprot:Skav200581  [mRNA]  locus=scaffold1051:18458:24228:- [translate_table: standard]
MAAQELSKASAESLKLLKNLLVLDPSQRITAQEALRHDWFQLDASGKVCVPLEKYRRARSASMSSQGRQLCFGGRRRDVMPAGLVTTWLEEKGFGFIAPDDSNLGDLFVHVSELRDARANGLERGDRVGG